MSDNEDLANHVGHATMAAELAVPSDDLPQGVPGNDKVYQEYLPQRPEPEPREQRQPEQPRPQEYARDQQAPQEQRQQPQQRQSYRELPDINEAPVEHFSARAANMEAWAQQAHATQQAKDFWGAVDQSEKNFSGELTESEYSDATDLLKASRMQELAYAFPDTHENQVLAYRHGFASAAHMREAQLRKDAADVAAHAMRNGQDPAGVFYSLALQRGHKPRTVMTKSFSRAVLNNIDKASDKEFDQFWRAYEIASRQVEGSK